MALTELVQEIRHLKAGAYKRKIYNIRGLDSGGESGTLTGSTVTKITSCEPIENRPELATYFLH
jgi:hypothetical protein